MELRIISREIIKPSSPTPPHLRTYKLSLLDLITPDIYFPIILFYSGKSNDTIDNTSNHLKNSLSETLTHYYPFAGRVKDGFSVDCDDYGATFIEACVADEMSELLKQPEMDLLEQLLPCKPFEKPINTQLVVQVSYFGCGGMAICVCFSHAIADATSAANFIKNWATIACGNSIDVRNVIFDCTSIFPPQDASSLKRSIQKGVCLSTETVAKRFIFDGNKISALREQIGNIGPGVDRPTRFEAVSVLLLGAVIAMARERDELLGAMIVVNLRKRLNPQLPSQCIGNIVQGVSMNVHCSRDKTDVDYNSLAGKLHESIKMMNDNSIRMMHADGGYLNFLRNAYEGVVSKNNIKIRKLYLTSWCRLPHYETDFGWGRPTWATSAYRLDDSVFLFDTCDGKGIEAWVCLSKEDMAKFEQDSAITSYASINAGVI